MKSSLFAVSLVVGSALALGSASADPKIATKFVVQNPKLVPTQLKPSTQVISNSTVLNSQAKTGQLYSPGVITGGAFRRP